nr:MAG TPA: oxidoreductase [Caudoviricetes sp.]
MSIAGMSENSKPVSIMLYVADICNLKCNYCYNMFPRSSKIISLR